MRLGIRTLAWTVAWTAALAALGCGDAGDALVGTWSGSGSAGTITFEDDGSASWVLGEASAADTFDVEYELDPSADPTALDLTGFDHGPYAGHSLFCIVDFPAPEAFRLDCVPGDDPAARPEDFGNQTIRFERTADEAGDG